MPARSSRWIHDIHCLPSPNLPPTPMRNGGSIRSKAPPRPSSTTPVRTRTTRTPNGSAACASFSQAWQKEAQAAEPLGVRVVRVRTGVVLDGRGGALLRMLPPFRMGVGGRLGDGKQWMSWIHLEDLAGMFQFALDHPVSGALNGIAPYPVINAEFTRALAQALHRPAIFPVPAFALKALFGEMSEILLGSQRVTPAAAEAAGFPFRFPQLAPALAEALRV